MSEQIEQVERLRAEGSSVKTACQKAGIPVHTYYNRRKPNRSHVRVPREPAKVEVHDIANSQYLAILDALRNLHTGDIQSARKTLIDALLM